MTFTAQNCRQFAKMKTEAFTVLNSTSPVTITK